MSVPAVIPSPIAIAGFKDVYQVLRVEEALTGTDDHHVPRQGTR